MEAAISIDNSHSFQWEPQWVCVSIGGVHKVCTQNFLATILESRHYFKLVIRGRHLSPHPSNHHGFAWSRGISKRLWPSIKYVCKTLGFFQLSCRLLSVVACTFRLHSAVSPPGTNLSADLVYVYFKIHATPFHCQLFMNPIQCVHTLWMPPQHFPSAVSPTIGTAILMGWIPDRHKAPIAIGGRGGGGGVRDAE